MLSVYVNIWSILVLALTTDSYMVTYNDQARVAANHVCGMEWCCWWVLLIVGGLMVGLGGPRAQPAVLQSALSCAAMNHICCHASWRFQLHPLTDRALLLLCLP